MKASVLRSYQEHAQRERSCWVRDVGVTTVDAVQAFNHTIQYRYSHHCTVTLQLLQLLLPVSSLNQCS